MRHRTSTVLVALGATFGLLPVVTANAQPRSSVAPRASTDEAGGEYVVAFDTANQDAALAAVEAAGGVVVDVQEAIGLALVETSSATFTEAVQQDAAVTGVVQNQSIGADEQGKAQVRATERLTAVDDEAAAAAGAAQPQTKKPKRPKPGKSPEPLESLQWGLSMIGATLDGAHRKTTGDHVKVGIMDTGVDASHPDIAPNFDYALSRNFTHDIPAIDGPCEVVTCIDPAWVDEGGHGTHVAGIVAAARNGVGVSGVAPDATIVNVRAGQDSGYFFFYETVVALLYSGDVGLDVVNMSFYTDPWLYNCPSADDYISGEFTEEQIEEQATIRAGIIAALEYAHDHGVTLVGAAGNQLTNLALAERSDATSPDYPPGTEQERVVTSDCLSLPSEGPHVIAVSALGPSGTKADYSNYGLGSIDVSAPGGWFRDLIGTPRYRTFQNYVLSSYPYDVALANGYFATGQGIAECDAQGENCVAWVYLQGTSMASPHVAGLAALVIDAHNLKSDPDTVGEIIATTAVDHACPAGGVEIYTDEGRPPEYNAVCDGTTAYNGIYGEGVVNAVAATAKH